MTAALEIRNASKSFGAHKVLDGVDLTVEAGQTSVILGPSGSGKSTLLRAVNQLERLDTGYVRVGGELIGVRVRGHRFKQLSDREALKQRAKIGFVFQAFNLFPHLTILDNVIEGPLAHRRASKQQAREQGEKLLARVGLLDKAQSYPRQLSGGQQQRAAIARALALEPELIVFDEPTSALDPELVGEVLGVVRDLAGSGATLVIVTHEIGFAREVADRVVFLDAGRVLEEGTAAEVLDTPRHRRTQDFLSKVL